jgi:hypothetical protein
VIVRIITGLIALGFIATLRGFRRRARRKKASPPAMTVRNGYTGVENRLYRAEISRGGKADGVTFSWSREGRRDAERHTGSVQAGTWIALEDGIDVCFEGHTFSPGDVWTFQLPSAADTITLKARRKGSPTARGRAKRRR